MLEAAVNGRAQAIITHNLRDFASVNAAFGIRPITPGVFLQELLP